MELPAIDLVLAAVAATAAFVMSAAAGLGGSLVLVPSLAMVLGAKKGVALAALLLGSNNVVKLVSYRRSVPWRRAIVLAATAGVGALVGARLLVQLPDNWVVGVVLVSLAAAFIFERLLDGSERKVNSLERACFFSTLGGLTSGVSGTSGPLKGVAIRSWVHDRFHFVGAASLVSLVGDLTKSAVFVDAGILDVPSVWLAILLVPVMIASTFVGRTINQRIGEAGYSILFWSVLSGYSVRLILGVI